MLLRKAREVAKLGVKELEGDLIARKQRIAVEDGRGTIDQGRRLHDACRAALAKIPEGTARDESMRLLDHARGLLSGEHVVAARDPDLERLRFFVDTIEGGWFPVAVSWMRNAALIGVPPKLRAVIDEFDRPDASPQAQFAVMAAAAVDLLQIWSALPGLRTRSDPRRLSTLVDMIERLGRSCGAEHDGEWSDLGLALHGFGLLVEAVIADTLAVADGDRDLVVLRGEEVARPILEATCALDARVYSPAEAGLPDVGERWIRRYPDAVQVVVGRGEVLGYVTALPARADLFSELVSGAVRDIEIPDELIATTREPCDVYLVSIAIQPGLGALRERVVTRLLDAFMGSMLRLVRGGRPPRRIVADASTGLGERLCKRFGMTPVASAAGAPPTGPHGRPWDLREIVLGGTPRGLLAQRLERWASIWPA